jgi:hypothetical protein
LILARSQVFINAKEEIVEAGGLKNFLHSQIKDKAGVAKSELRFHTRSPP